MTLVILVTVEQQSFPSLLKCAAAVGGHHLTAYQSTDMSVIATVIMRCGVPCQQKSAPISADVR
jgi:hypothetical protein